MQLAGTAVRAMEVAQPQRLTRAASNSGIANATANATGGAVQHSGGAGGAATANASAANGGSAVAQATGGNVLALAPGGAATANASATNGGSAVAQATGGSSGAICTGGPASATATSTAMLGGTANATATATGERSLRSCRMVQQTPIPPLRRSMAMRPKRSPLPLARSGQAQATAQTNFGNFQSVQSTSTSPRPLSARSVQHRPVQSHRPVVSFLFPTRSLQGRVFRSLVDQALVL